eukprot:TRINITY_DN1411_c0_g2_i2.p2 TRINITY_DN1411_c0_g2~~TRINITY_DN1411_c0_g2_i2.p2  ORF type:complete len:184 (-),score=73.07 TRINITY_DN1411_c0_g2_i2:14-565(-)
MTRKRARRRQMIATAMFGARNTYSASPTPTEAPLDIEWLRDSAADGSMRPGGGVPPMGSANASAAFSRSDTGLPPPQFDSMAATNHSGAFTSHPLPPLPEIRQPPNAGSGLPAPSISAALARPMPPQPGMVVQEQYNALPVDPATLTMSSSSMAFASPANILPARPSLPPPPTIRNHVTTINF